MISRMMGQLISVLLVLFLSPAIPLVVAQSGNGPDPYPYARFSPSMAIIIAVLVTALFFMGFFSIYIRRRSSSGGSIRPVLSRRAGGAARGLEASVIDTFPTLAYSEVKGLKIGKGALECAVCLNEFDDNEMLRLLPKCDHVFHPDCIDAWLASHVTCPVCRADLLPQPPDPQNQNDEPPQANHTSIEVPPPPPPPPPPLPKVMNRNESLKQLSGPGRFMNRFRSHSTGHSLIQPGENVDRFTLRLPEDVRKQVLKRAVLNRTASGLVVLPSQGSSRRGFRTGEGSHKGGRSYHRLESLDRPVRSDRWGFSRVPSFLSRALSVRSPKVVAAKGEASTSTSEPV